MPQHERFEPRNRKKPRALAGLTMALGAMLLSGCSEAESVPTLTWYINPDDGGQAAIAERCTADSGGAYRIETSLLPNDAASQREQLARRLKLSVGSRIDVPAAAGDWPLQVVGIYADYGNPKGHVLVNADHLLRHWPHCATQRS